MKRCRLSHKLNGLVYCWAVIRADGFRPRCRHDGNADGCQTYRKALLGPIPIPPPPTDPTAARKAGMGAIVQEKRP